MPGGPGVGDVIDGWRLERALGRGGFGVVFEARRAGDLLPVALKLIPSNATTQFEAIEREASFLDALGHHNIVAFRGGARIAEGPYAGWGWIATEVCDHSLEDVLVASPVSTADCRRIVLEIATALDVAHSRRCVHRDVKPANILWRGRWKLADFGIGRVLAHGEDRAFTRNIRGTLEYLSADAITSGPSQQADLYALGVTAHRAITGVVVHPRRLNEDDVQYLVRITNEPPRISPLLTRDWERLVRMMLGLDGDVTAREVIEAVSEEPARTVGRVPVTDADEATVRVVDPTPLIGAGTVRGGTHNGPPGARPGGRLAIADAARRAVIAVAIGVAVVLALFLVVRLPG